MQGLHPSIVLETKLHPPPARPGLVERAGLLGHLAESEASVVVVGAPAGYGKTVLLSQYAAVVDRPFVWLSLDQTDADPVLLALELATAIDRVAPVDARVFASLGAPAPAIQRVVLPGLVNGLHAAGDVVLAVDDLHLVDSPESVAVVSFLCEHLPPGAQLLVASRDTSALPLGTLRLNGRLLELGWRDLALSRAEVEGLLRAAGAPLEGLDPDALHERTEGWPAAVYLAALALREGGGGRGSGIGVAGDDRDLVDYLSGELLTRLPPERLSFLLRTSVLDRFSAALCDAVLDRQDSAQEIAELEHSNLFVVPLDRRREWYRYHHLFRDVLRAELARRNGRSVPSLHRRASRWHEREGTPEEAVQHALAARDMRRAAELVVHAARGLTRIGRLATVRSWLEAFPDDVIAGSGPLAMTAAHAMALSGERQRARRYVAVAEGAPWSGLGPVGETSPEAAVALIKATYGWEGVSRMRADALTAYRLLPAGHPAHEHAAVVLGCCLMLLGRTAEAVPLLEEGSALGEAAAMASILGLGVLAQIALEEGRLDAVAARVREGLALIDELEFDDHAASVSVDTAAACLGARRGDLSRARAHLEKARSVLPRVAAAPWESIRTRALLGGAALALGDLPLTGALLEEARRELADYPDAGILPRLLAREERALEAARGGAGVLGQPLTVAELRVLELLPTHLSLAEIGETLHISRNTVKAHVRSIYTKLDASGRAGAVARARRHGVLARDQSPVGGDAPVR